MDASEILRLINKERQSRGLTLLSSDPSLQRAAETKAEDMSTGGYFSHKSPTGATFLQLLEREDYAYKLAAENIAFNSDPYGIVGAWMKSPGHRANILNPAFDSTGIGLSQGRHQNHEVTFAAQLFAQSQNQVFIAVSPPAAPAVAPATAALALSAPPKLPPAPSKQESVKPEDIARTSASQPSAAASSSPAAASPEEETAEAASPSEPTAAAAVSVIVSDPPQPPIAGTNQFSEFFVAPALIAAAVIASLRSKKLLPRIKWFANHGRNRNVIE